MMFDIKIGDIKFKIYPLLDENMVVIKLHDVMKVLSNTYAYNTVMINIEKFIELAENAIKEDETVNVYTLIILMSPRHLNTNEIATLFKEAYKRHKNNWENFYGQKRR